MALSYHYFGHHIKKSFGWTVTGSMQRCGKQGWLLVLRPVWVEKVVSVCHHQAMTSKGLDSWSWNCSRAGLEQYPTSYLLPLLTHILPYSFRHKLSPNTSHASSSSSFSQAKLALSQPQHLPVPPKLLPRLLPLSPMRLFTSPLCDPKHSSPPKYCGQWPSRQTSSTCHQEQKMGVLLVHEHLWLLLALNKLLRPMPPMWLVDFIPSSSATQCNL